MNNQPPAKWYIDSEVLSGSLLIATLKQKGDDTKWYIPKEYIEQLQSEAYEKGLKDEERAKRSLHQLEIEEARADERKKILEFIESNALDQTSYSDICWDDGDIMFKKTDLLKQGDWSQEEWNNLLENFEPKYLHFNELVKELEQPTVNQDLPTSVSERNVSVESKEDKR